VNIEEAESRQPQDDGDCNIYVRSERARQRMMKSISLTSRTAVYGPVRTVVWQGSAGDCRPYADQVG
jgi:hypothetical protein